MRLQLGPIPEEEGFHPEAEGWLRVREPSTGLLILSAVPVSIVMCLALLRLWTLILPAPLLLGVGSGFAFTISLWRLVAFIAALVGFSLLHEVMHTVPAILTGHWKDLVLGFWPKYLVPYVASTGSLSRNGQLLSGVLPLIALTAMPLLVAALLPRVAMWLALLSVVNVLGSGADLIMLVILSRQVPRAAVIRNHGYSTWWRLAVRKADEADYCAFEVRR